jgi:SnoaL-like domain
MSKRVAISPEEAADRLAIRELIEAYAHCADRRDAKGQMALFTGDTHLVVYMNPETRTPRKSCTRGRRSLRSSPTSISMLRRCISSDRARSLR